MRGVERIPWLYDGFMVLLERLGLEGWRRSLVPEAPLGGILLEVGCGTGRNLGRYVEGQRVVGLDPDAHLLKAARRRSPGALLVQARAEALPFRDASVSTVVSSLVFCSVQDPRAGLAEVSRVLEPGGRLRMLEHVVPSTRLLAGLARAVQPAWTVLAGGCHPDRDTEGLVREAGFRVESSTRRAHGPLRRFDAVPLKDLDARARTAAKP